MMTNLQSSAFVARTTQLLSSVARLRLLLVMLLTLTASTAWGETETITLSDFGWGNATVQSSITATSATISLAKNSAGTAPTYYTSDGLRIYGVKNATTGGTISFTPKKGITISKIVFTHTSSNSGVLAIKTGTGSYSSKTWSGTLTAGNTVSLVSTNSGSSNPQVRITQIVITYTTAVASKHTVTFDAGSGTCDTSSLTESTAGDGVTLPTSTICEGWSFAGWAEASVATETEEAPTTLYEADDTYKPTSDITLYAVYKRTEEGEGGGGTPIEVSKTYTFSDYEVGTQYAEETYELDDDVTINIKGCHINTQLRVYGGQPGIVISEGLPGRIVSMGFNMGYKADNLVVSGSTDGTSWNEVGSISTTTSYKDYTLDFGETNYTYFKLNVEGSSQIRIAKMSITYESTSGGGSTTYYYSYPQCATQTVVYLIPKNSDFWMAYLRRIFGASSAASVALP